MHFDVSHHSHDNVAMHRHDNLTSTCSGLEMAFQDVPKLVFLVPDVVQNDEKLLLRQLLHQLAPNLIQPLEFEFLRGDVLENSTRYFRDIKLIRHNNPRSDTKKFPHSIVLIKRYQKTNRSLSISPKKVSRQECLRPRRYTWRTITVGCQRQ